MKVEQLIVAMVALNFIGFIGIFASIYALISRPIQTLGVEGRDAEDGVETRKTTVKTLDTEPDIGAYGENCHIGAYRPSKDIKRQMKKSHWY